MSAGIPLDDDDRRPWLEALASLQAFHHAEGISTVLTCSALKRAYRDVLRGGVPAGSVPFVHLAAPFEVLRERMESREHFMPASLLQSQLDTLEPLGADEPGTVVDVSLPLADVVRAAVAARPRLRPRQSRCIAAVASTSSPASSEASQSTTASMTQSWSPAGSWIVWRTSRSRAVVPSSAPTGSPVRSGPMSSRSGPRASPSTTTESWSA